MDILKVLLNKKTMVIAEKEDLDSPGRLSLLIRETRVDFVAWTPSRFLKLLSNPEVAGSLRRIRMAETAGEKIPQHLYEMIKQHMPDAVLLISYGMSEMMHLSDHPFAPGEENMFRSNVENVTLHVLDSRGNPVKKGEEQ